MPLIRIATDGAAATIDSDRGGRLASLVVAGRELLVGPYDDADRSMRWGCFLMAPWPGRLANASFDWAGRTIRLPRTHGWHAIHGLVWDREWTEEATAADRATLSCALPPAWPMRGEVRQTMTLTAGRLVLDASVTAGDAMPAAIGWHPWFDRAGDPVAVRVDADEVQETRRMIPTGRSVPVSGTRDLRPGPILGSRRLDLAYLGARSPATVQWPDLRLTLVFEPSPSTVVVYTPRNAVCVEPQTASPNALALDSAGARAAGVRFLAAGETLAARLTLDWSDAR